MAAEYEYTAADGQQWAFDFTNEIIYTAQSTILRVPELMQAVRTAEDSVLGTRFHQIALRDGNIALGTEEDGYVAWTLSLLRSWVVQSERTSGTLYVKSGNLAQKNTGDPFGISLGVRYIGMFSTASSYQRIVTGSALTIEERARLFAIPTETLTETQSGNLDSIRTIVETIAGNYLTEQKFKLLSFNRTNVVLNKMIQKYRPNNEFDVNATYDTDGIPTSEAIAP